MEKIPLPIEGALLLRPKVFRDKRGFFLESWNRESFRGLVLDVEFAQDNHSRSSRGVLRGLHYQIGVAAQGKLVWVTSGEVYDVIVDLRRSSATFGQWCGHWIDAQTHDRIWVPPGCAHGFLVTSDTADFHYKCTQFYLPHSERALLWNDRSVQIEWPLPSGASPLLSPKDAEAPEFADCYKFD